MVDSPTESGRHPREPDRVVSRAEGGHGPERDERRDARYEQELGNMQRKCLQPRRMEEDINLEYEM